jgi:hypothetical protein
MIQPISLIQPLPQPTFQGRYKMNGSNPDLKALWDRGKLPTVKYGFYGDKLDFNTVTREHLLPKSKGGTKRFGNIVLASKVKNNGRGNGDIRDFIDIEAAKNYLKQFLGLKEPIDGNRYVQAVQKTLKFLGVDLKH